MVHETLQQRRSAVTPHIGGTLRRVTICGCGVTLKSLVLVIPFAVAAFFAGVFAVTGAGWPVRCWASASSGCFR